MRRLKQLTTVLHLKTVNPQTICRQRSQKQCQEERDKFIRFPLLLNNETEHWLECISSAKSLCYRASTSLLLPLALLVVTPGLVVCRSPCNSWKFPSACTWILCLVMLLPKVGNERWKTSDPGMETAQSLTWRTSLETLRWELCRAQWELMLCKGCFLHVGV